ncbi:MAG TPA: hypothetical protein PKN52_11835, partial [Trueperaceae bacterium]|nr:hypothetical protein [Trueperaceae bacterium]
MNDITAQPLVSAVEAGGRYLGLTAAARLMLFARAPGPAVLLTTSDRAALFDDTHVFGALRTVDPTLAEWHERREKVVLTLGHAVGPFPEHPEAFALELTKGRSYARDELLERLVNYGYVRDAAPGFTVRGDTVTLYREPLPESAVGEDTDDAEPAFPEAPPGSVRLEFFGDELDALFVAGEEAQRMV